MAFLLAQSDGSIESLHHIGTCWMINNSAVGNPTCKRNDFGQLENHGQGRCRRTVHVFSPAYPFPRSRISQNAMLVPVRYTPIASVVSGRAQQCSTRRLRNDRRGGASRHPRAHTIVLCRITDIAIVAKPCAHPGSLGPQSR